MTENEGKGTDAKIAENDAIAKAQLEAKAKKKAKKRAKKKANKKGAKKQPSKPKEPGFELERGIRMMMDKNPGFGRTVARFLGLIDDVTRPGREYNSEGNCDHDHEQLAELLRVLAYMIEFAGTYQRVQEDDMPRSDYFAKQRKQRLDQLSKKAQTVHRYSSGAVGK